MQKIINDDKPVLKVTSAEFGYNVHHTLLYIFSLMSLLDYDVKMPNFTLMAETNLNLDLRVLWNSTPEEFAYFGQSRRVGHLKL